MWQKINVPAVLQDVEYVDLNAFNSGCNNLCGPSRDALHLGAGMGMTSMWHVWDASEGCTDEESCIKYTEALHWYITCKLPGSVVNIGFDYRSSS
jgi:hypothetical protein